MTARGAEDQGTGMLIMTADGKAWKHVIVFEVKSILQVLNRKRLKLHEFLFRCYLY